MFVKIGFAPEELFWISLVRFSRYWSIFVFVSIVLTLMMFSRVVLAQDLGQTPSIISLFSWPTVVL